MPASSDQSPSSRPSQAASATASASAGRRPRRLTPTQSPGESPSGLAHEGEHAGLAHALVDQERPRRPGGSHDAQALDRLRPADWVDDRQDDGRPTEDPDDAVLRHQGVPRAGDDLSALSAEVCSSRNGETMTRSSTYTGSASLPPGSLQRTHVPSADAGEEQPVRVRLRQCEGDALMELLRVRVLGRRREPVADRVAERNELSCHLTVEVRVRDQPLLVPQLQDLLERAALPEVADRRHSGLRGPLGQQALVHPSLPRVTVVLPASERGGESSEDDEHGGDPHRPPPSRSERRSETKRWSWGSRRLTS